MKKGLIILILTAILVPLFSLTAAAAEKVDEPKITLEEKEEGYGVFYPLGLKYQLPSIFEDSKYVKRRQVGLDTNEKDLIYFSRQYWFRTQAMTQQYNELRLAELSKDTFNEKVRNEVAAHDKPVFGFFVLNVENIPEDEEALKEQLGFSELTTIAETDGLRQVYAKAERNDQDLTDEEKEEYNRLFDSLSDLEASIQYFKPMKEVESIGAVENWEFSTFTLDGIYPVDQQFLKNSPLTLVTYWATWCPHCLIEMRTLGWYRELYGKSKNVQVLAVTADLWQEDYEPELLEKALDILEQQNADITAVFNGEEMENDLFKYVMNYPTSFFVDSNGKVLKVYVEEPELEVLLEDSAAILSQMNKAATEGKNVAQPVQEAVPAPYVQETVPAPVGQETQPGVQETWPNVQATQPVQDSSSGEYEVVYNTVPLVTNEFGQPFDPSQDSDCGCGE